MRSTSTKNGAQLHTLEGLAGAIVLLLAVGYAFNAFVLTAATDVDPGTEANEKLAEDLLSLQTQDDELMVKDLLLHWNASSGEARFVNSTTGTYYYEGEPADAPYLEYGDAVDSVLSSKGLSYNIEASYNRDGGNETGSMTMVYNGEPGFSAVSATRTVVLSDDDNVTTASGETPLLEVDQDPDLVYPIPKDREATYNRVRVTMTVW